MIDKATHKPWAMEVEEILSLLDVPENEGLTIQDVQKRRKESGPNQLRTHERKSAWKILVEQFDSIIVWLLIISAGISFVFGEWIDGVAILTVVAINSMISFFTELRAIRSMEALRELTSVETRVRREGQVEKIPAKQLVPGDIVLLEGGDIVTADLRLIEASKLQANESTLTGESEPVAKTLGSLDVETTLAERMNMVFKGTSVTRGSGTGVVAFTGMETELGEISSLVEEAEEEHTPLEERLDKLGRRLVWFTLIIIIIVALTGILRGKEFRLMIETSIALAVAAVPEGLPIVATIALARGMRRMAQRKALINRLASVETLGGTNVICTDKTGTLTENQLTVTRVLFNSDVVHIGGKGMTIEGQFEREGHTIGPDDDPVLESMMKVGVLCTNAELQPSEGNQVKGVGEPLEVALLVAGKKAGIDRADLLSDMPEEREVAFEPELKMMATIHDQNGEVFVAVKGAPEAVVEVCKQQRTHDGFVDLDHQKKEDWMEKNKQLAAEGLRIIALAYKKSESVDVEPYENLKLLGLAALLDPPREDVRTALKDCRKAGIQVVMVTGDHAVTARKIAADVGLVEDDPDFVLGQELKPSEQIDADIRQRILNSQILARVSPKQKLDLISIHQETGAVVAMTGDGVNDAPALKKADIGIAMGQRGTQVAREASDMILEDDRFSTIVLAVRLGRVIFNNIRRFVMYLLSCNVSEILIVFIASLINMRLPIRPLQILYLNLVTDVFPALALGVGEGDPSVMTHAPRDPNEPILQRAQWINIGSYAFVITLSVLAAFGLAQRWLEMGIQQTISISFLTLAYAQLWHVFNMRNLGSHFFRNDVFQNPYVWGALVLCVFLTLGAVYIPPLANLLNVVDPGIQGWGLILGMSIIPWLFGQVYLQIKSLNTNE